MFWKIFFGYREYPPGYEPPLQVSLRKMRFLSLRPLTQISPGVWRLRSRGPSLAAASLVVGVLALSTWAFWELTRSRAEPPTHPAIIVTGVVGVLLAFPLWFISESYTFDESHKQIRYHRVRPWGTHRVTLSPDEFRIAKTFVTVTRSQRSEGGEMDVERHVLVAISPIEGPTDVLAAAKSEGDLNLYIRDLPPFVRSCFDPGLEIEASWATFSV